MLPRGDRIGGNRSEIAGPGVEPGQRPNGAASAAGTVRAIFGADGGTCRLLSLFGTENTGLPGFGGENPAKSESNLLAADPSWHPGRQKTPNTAQREHQNGAGAVLSSGAAVGRWAGNLPQRPGMGGSLRDARPAGAAAVSGGAGVKGKMGDLSGFILLFMKEKV